MTTADRNKWPTLAVMAALLAATVAEWYWVWGVFFFYWTIGAVVSGETFVVQTVRRNENPGVFWFVVVIWFALSVLMVLPDTLTAH